MKTIAIISGAGPYAGVKLHEKLIRKMNQAGIYKDADFPLIKHISYPFSATDGFGVRDFALSQKELNSALQLCGEADRIVIACMSLLLSVPFELKNVIFNPVEEIVNRVHAQPVVILASQSSINSGVYKEIPNITYPSPVIQNKVNHLIDCVMRGQYSEALFTRLMMNVQKKYPDELILLGCTELCIFKPKDDVLNVLDIMVDHVMKL